MTAKFEQPEQFDGKEETLTEEEKEDEEEHTRLLQLRFMENDNFSEEDALDRATLEVKSEKKTTEDGLSKKDYIRLLQLRFMANNNLSKEEALDRATLQRRADKGEKLTNEEDTRLNKMISMGNQVDTLE